MSPEQTLGVGVDHRSDIWAFGVIAYECLLGVRPFDNDTLGGLFNAICVAERPVPSTQNTVPEGFDGWFERATARDVNERFQTIQEALTALRLVCGHGSFHSLMSPAFTHTDRAVPAQNARLADTPPPSARTISHAHNRRSWMVLVTGLSGMALIVVASLTAWRCTRTMHASAAPPSALVSTATPPTRREPLAEPGSSGKHFADVAAEASAVVETGVVPSALPLIPRSIAPHLIGTSGQAKTPSEKTSSKVLGSSTRKKENVAGF